MREPMDTPMSEAVMHAKKSNHAHKQRLYLQNQHLLELIDDFFDMGAASDKIKTLNFLLTSWMESEDFEEYNKEAISNTVFDVNQFSEFIVKLQEMSSQNQENK